MYSTTHAYEYLNSLSQGVRNLNIPPTIGNILGTFWGGPLVDWYIVKLSQKNGGIYEPEMCLALFPLPTHVNRRFHVWLINRKGMFLLSIRFWTLLF